MKKKTLRISKKYLFVGLALFIFALGIASFLFFSTSVFSFLGLKGEKQSSLTQKIAEDMMQKCQAEGERCYSTEFYNLATIENLDTSIAILDEINLLDSQTRGCHLIAHSISTAETMKDTDKWKDILQKVPADRCTGGFLHGIFEARQSKDPTIKVNEETIPQFCKIVEERSNGGNDQDCAHIFGHLLVVVNDADLTKASEVCKKLPEELQYECQSGVFMENETRDGIVQHGLGDYLPWNEKNIQNQEEICETQSGTASKACWREISHMYAFFAKDYPPEILRLCSQAENIDDVTDCYQHGMGISVVSRNFDTNNFSLICAPFTNDSMYRMCVSQVIGALMTSSLAFSDRVKMFCEVIPEGYKDTCYERYGKYVLSLAGSDALPTYCSDIKYPYKEYCEEPFL